MKQTLPKGMVAVPTPTLAAIKALLTSESGIDVSPIVEDLAVSPDHKDFMFINVALVMKGKVPDIGKYRYKKEGNLLLTYEATHFSLISGIVSVKKTALRYKAESDTYVDYDMINHEDNIDYCEWADMTDDRRSVLDQFKAVPK
jgi:hypothetical protein